MATWLQLAERHNDMLIVTLDYCPNSKVDPSIDPIRVHVHNERNGQDFTLYPNPDKALDCFHHPFAYLIAFLNGKSTRAGV